MYNKHVFQFGCMELIDDYAVLTCNEGVHIDLNEIEAIVDVLDTAYSNKKFGFITN